jgi:hypothetical protein
VPPTVFETAVPILVPMAGGLDDPVERHPLYRHDLSHLWSARLVVPLVPPLYLCVHAATLRERARC